MKPRDERSVDEVAAEWFEIRDDMALDERIEFRAWLGKSARHVEAYWRTAAIDQKPHHMDAERLHRALKAEDPMLEWSISDKASNRWKNIKEQPIPIIAGVVVFTVIATWAVSEAVIVQPLRARIEVLQADLNDARAGVATAQAGKNQKPTPTRP